MQAAGNVRRRDHDAETFLAGIAIRFEIALAFPVIVQLLFDLGWVIGGIEIGVGLFHFYFKVQLVGGVAVVKWKPTLR